MKVGGALRLACCCAFIGYIVYVARPGSSLFSWHPFLMAVAFTGLMTEAIFTFSDPGMGSGQPHSARLTKHWVLLVATAATHALGVASIYYTKEANNKPHFTSWHASVGGIAALLLWVQLLGGVFSKYPRLLGNIVSLRSLRAGHSFSGSVGYTFGIVTLILGLGTVWYQSNAAVWSVWLALVLHVVLLFGVFKRHYKKYVMGK